MQRWSPNLPWRFNSASVAGQPIEIYGTGEQVRELNYVDDVVDALLLAVNNEKSAGQVYNLGSPEPIRLLDLAQLMIEIFGAGSYELRTFPPERLRIDIGDYQGDYSKISAELGWQPKTPLREGLARTLEYYRQYQEFLLVDAKIFPINLKAQYLSIKPEIDAAVARVIVSGQFI